MNSGTGGFVKTSSFDNLSYIFSTSFQLTPARSYDSWPRSRSLLTAYGNILDCFVPEEIGLGLRFTSRGGPWITAVDTQKIRMEVMSEKSSNQGILLSKMNRK